MKAARKGELACMVHRQRAWYRLRLGRLLLEAERTHLSKVLPDLFGYHLIQIGSLADTNLLSASRIAHRVVLDANIRSTASTLPGLYARPDALPILSDSVDVVVLPHILEFEADPHQVLREAERILIPEGSIVVLGFNPWSLWGVWCLLLGRSNIPPWYGRFLSLTRIRDWLALLGFDEVQMYPYFFRPPLHHAGIMKKLNIMETAGARWWPHLAGAYMLVAKKRVSTITPIKPRWLQQRRLVAAASPVEPSVRIQRHE